MKNKLNKIKTALVVALCFALTLLVVACSTTQYRLSYTAGTGGTITGEVTQTVDEGKDGSEVIAVANSGYVFVKWSDGITTANRTDKNVQKDLSVTAEFKVDTQGSGSDFVGNVVVSFDEGFVGSWAYIGNLSSPDAQIVFNYDEDSELFNIDKRLKVMVDGKVSLEETGYYGTTTYEGKSESHSSNSHKVTLSDGENEYLNKTLFLVSQKDGYLYASNATYEGEYNESAGFVVFAKISGDVTEEKNADGSEKASSFLYKVVGNEIEIVKYVGINTEIKIPSQIDGKNVTRLGKSAMVATNAQSVVFPSTIKSIGDNAFCHAQNIKSITFEQNSQLDSIGEKAFYLSALQRVTIPASTTYIGPQAFADCKLAEIEFEQNSQIKTIGASAFSRCGPTESLVLPKTLKTIGKGAFGYMNSLKQVTFENDSQLEIIDEYAFNFCSGITKFDIPSGVRSIGGMAFYGCHFKNIVIPASVQEMGYNVFAGSVSRTVVYCEAESKPEGWPEYWYDYTAAHYWGVYTVTDNQGLVFAIKGNYATVSEFDDGTKNVVVPSTIDGKTVVAIGNAAFGEKTNLETITLPEGIVTIGRRAFFSSSLKTIDIPASVQEIGEDAFYLCTELTAINMPQDSQLKTIGRFAIEHCTKLKTFVIPASVEYVGENVFFGSTEIRVYCQAPSQPSGWSEYWGREDMFLLPVYWDVQQIVVQDGIVFAIHTNEASVVDFQTTTNTVISVPEKVNGKPVTVIGKKAFAWYPYLEQVILPDSVKTIDAMAFKYCQHLTSINLPQNLQTIGEEAFYECQVLTNLVLPNNLKSIGNNAFYGCDAIGQIVVPQTIEVMGHSIFFNCYRIIIYCEATSLPDGWHVNWDNGEGFWYSQNQPTTDGNWWRYVDGVPTIWVTE